MKRFLMVILSLLTVISIGFSFLSIKKQKDQGISAVRGYIDDDVRRHVVAEYGDAIESLNKRLTEELTNSKATIDQLANIWEVNEYQQL